MNESDSFGIFRPMSTKGQRIKQVRNKLQLTQDAFADLLGGVSRGAVGNWERDQGIKEENLELISEKTGVSFEWLVRGIGKMDPQGEAEAAVTRSTALVRVPDLAIFGGLGGGGLLSVIQGDSNVPLDPDSLRGYWTFPEYVVRGLAGGRNIYAWEVRGDSMLPTLPGGSIVFVDTKQNRMPPEDIYAMDYGDGLMVKRLKLIPRTNKLLVVSDNAKYPADELLREDVVIYGRVVGWFQWRE